MKHEDFERLVSRLADHELDPTGQKILDAHLALCPGCRELSADLAALKQSFAALPAEAPSTDLDRLVMARAWEAAEPRMTLGERLRAALASLQPTLAYAAVALVIGAAGGGLGFQLNGASGAETSPRFISEEEAGLFDLAPPGSLTEALAVMEKEQP